MSQGGITGHRGLWMGDGYDDGGVLQQERRMMTLSKWLWWIGGAKNLTIRPLFLQLPLTHFSKYKHPWNVQVGRGDSSGGGGGLNSSTSGWTYPSNFLGLCKGVIISPILVHSPSPRYQNLAELFSFNRCFLHLHTTACCTDDLSRRSISSYKNHNFS